MRITFLPLLLKFWRVADTCAMSGPHTLVWILLSMSRGITSLDIVELSAGAVISTSFEKPQISLNAIWISQHFRGPTAPRVISFYFPILCAYLRLVPHAWSASPLPVLKNSHSTSSTPTITRNMSNHSSDVLPAPLDASRVSAAKICCHLSPFYRKCPLSWSLPLNLWMARMPGRRSLKK
ncbi:hypothetical protein C8R44DRAFT_789008 [Mycena epipterygia]|nr:hypothetical protein C8R44DRAFT_789008 [Mycena epipterygia]